MNKAERKCLYCGKLLDKDLLNNFGTSFCSEDCYYAAQEADEFAENFPKGTDF